MSVDHVFLVCGFGRCGSSLAMQMLEAGGFPTSGEWPGFEDEIVLRHAPLAQWRSYVGRAVKCIDIHRFAPPVGLKYRAIVMQRDYREQAASQAKFAEMVMGFRLQRGARKLLAKSCADDLPQLLQVVERLCGPKGWSSLRFEDALAHPEIAAVQIAQLATGEVTPSLDIEAMARAVRARSPKCLPGLMEVDLVTERTPTPAAEGE